MNEIKGKPRARLFSSYKIEEKYIPDQDDDFTQAKMKQLRIEWNSRLPERHNTEYKYGPVAESDLQDFMLHLSNQAKLIVKVKKTINAVFLNNKYFSILFP
jgi:hypothetical protein